MLQRCCWMEEALVNDTLAIPALHESLERGAGMAGDLAHHGPLA